MSSFAVIVKKLTIKNHPNADALEIAEVDDYQSIVRKGTFKTGDLAAYIPEQALIPQPILQEMGLEGKLAGKQRNRLKPAKLRGVLSQGLCYPARPHWNEGDDVTEELGVEKWEPPIPAHLAGEVFSIGHDKTINYDIDNIKKYPDVFQPGEEVVMTEKIHGTLFCVGVLPEAHGHPKEGNVLISSKGLFARGLSLKPNAEKNKNNLYVRAARHYNIPQKIQKEYLKTISPGGLVVTGKDEQLGKPVYVFGELFGRGVQDLTYGAKTDTNHDVGCRIFDIYVGWPELGYFLNDRELDQACLNMSLERVPVVFRGAFSKETLEQHTSGIEQVSGKEMHIREGVVVRPIIERTDDRLPGRRVQLKSVSEHYLVRKGGTEFN